MKKNAPGGGGDGEIGLILPFPLCGPTAGRHYENRKERGNLSCLDTGCSRMKKRSNVQLGLVCFLSGLSK